MLKMLLPYTNAWIILSRYFCARQIIWELSGDLMEDLNTPLLDMVNRKLSESDTNCADPFGSKLAMEMEGAINLPNAATEATTEEAITMATTSSTAFSAVESASMEASPATISSVESSATVSSASSAAVSPTTISSASSGLDLYATVPVVSSASSATVSSASSGKDLYAPGQIVNGRKQVKRDTRKPKKPYRPQKDSITEL
mmetsp:Transcript_9790/g.20710  ORF Transcript_9790/g.20710 Transcript_9790/m.20710 type:complete len:201 (+) Transcript_9790:1758-2360(+)